MGYNAGGTVTGGNFYGNPAGGSLFQQAARTQRGLKKPARTGIVQSGQPVDMGRLRNSISRTSIGFALAGGKARGSIS